MEHSEENCGSSNSNVNKFPTANFSGNNATNGNDDSFFGAMNPNGSGSHPEHYSNSLFQQQNNEQFQQQYCQNVFQPPVPVPLPQPSSSSSMFSPMISTSSSISTSASQDSFHQQEQCKELPSMNLIPFTFPPNNNCNFRKPQRRGQSNRYQSSMRNTPPRLQRKHSMVMGNMGMGPPQFQMFNSNQNHKQFHSDRSKIETIDHINLISAKRCLSTMMALGHFSDLGRKKLLEYEFYPNWMDDKIEVQLNKQEVEGMISYLTNEGHEMQPFENIETRLSVFGLAPIICANAQAFLKILLEDYDGADDCLSESNEMIQLCINSKTEIIPRDYISGLFYIIKGLKVIVSCLSGAVGEGFDTNGFLCTAVEDFYCLPIKSKVAVWSSKYFFLKLMRNTSSLMYKEINEFVFMDPEYYEWRMHSYLSLRNKRRKRNGNESEPEMEEIKAIQFAWNLAPKNTLCLIYLALVTAECLRFQKFVNADRPLVVGQFQFSSVEEAASFIKRQCSVALKSNNHCIKINILASKILNLIPFKTRDNTMARECIFQAYRSGQNTSSKANHGLAMYMLMDVKTPVSSPTMCEAQLEKAYQLDKRNFEALYSLLQVYLSQSKDREPKIRLLFNIQHHNTDLTEESMAKLNFLKGCFHMMIGETNVALECWVSAYNCRQSNGLNFKMLQSLSYIFRIYRWPQEKINLPNVILETTNVLESLLSTTSPEANYKKKTILMEILELQQDALSSDIGYCLQQMSAVSGSDDLEKFNQSLGL